MILDRLSSKIVDVQRLDRNRDDDCYSWTIKALIRGDSLRELGVLYGGHYYTICEHPSSQSSSSQHSSRAHSSHDKFSISEPS